MSGRALHDLSALEQAAAIARRELSAVELAEHYLERSGRLGDEVGAFVTLTPDLALGQARKADRDASTERESNDPRFRLRGVVCPVKDLNAVAGVACRLGSAAVELLPDEDDGVVALLRSGGLVFTGKTNTPEFGLPCYTEPDVAPPARSPWNLDLSAGGSSGGAAAAVAAGLAPVAQGSDGGGSIRIPASVTGLVGVKPSRGRVTNGPLSDLVGDLIMQGPLARTVADAAALLDAMSGYQTGDPYSVPPLRGVSLLAAAQSDPGPLRVGYYLASALDVPPPSAEVVAAVESTAALLADLGHCVEQVDPPFGAWMPGPFGVIWAALAALTPVEPAREDRLRPLTRHLRRIGAELTGMDVAAAVSVLRVAARSELARTVEFDAVLAPTLSRRPVRVGELRCDEDPEADFRAQFEFSPFCSAYNITGQPAINVPLNWTDDGLPIGVQLAGRFGDEETIIALAGQLERAVSWRDRHPSMW